jgi:tRNA nucleotidyltransferase (CCA-adding enzyme)
MDAGQVQAHPEDSIEELQRLMTESGWGQIPVVNPESGHVIGIVTRTDLLKILTQQPSLPQPKNLASRLATTLPPARLLFLKSVAKAAHAQRAALYIVGGFVRDMLLDRPSLDFDLVVEGDAIQLAHSLSASFGGRVTSHARFGTSKWHIDEDKLALLKALEAENLLEDNDDNNADRSQTLNPEDLPDSLDLISARTEFYTHPTALPTVERGSIKLDLHRRDFTINTLALRLDGYHYAELHDYWGGYNDLQNGLIRVLHSLSFVDDPTRMLRAVRFEQRFDFRIEDRTIELINSAIRLLERVSGDRIRHELDHILGEAEADKMLARLDQLELLRAIQRNLNWDDWLSQRMLSLADLSPETEWRLEVSNNKLKIDLSYIIWLLRLTSPRTGQVVRRLKIPSKLAGDIFSAQELWRDIESLPSMKPSEVVMRLDGIEPLAIYANYLASSDPKVRDIIWKYTVKWRQIYPQTDGHVLQQLGLPPGPIYRQILQTLRAAWLDGTIDSPEEEVSLLEKMLPKK